MPQFSDIQEFTSHPAYAVFRSKAECHSRSSSSYMKALASLEAFLASQRHPFDFPSQEIIADWFVFMYNRRLSFKTALHYLNSVSALYSAAVKENVIPPSDVFRQIKSRITSLGALPSLFPPERLADVVGFTDRLPLRSSSDALAADFLLFALLSASTDFLHIASLKKENLDSLDSERRIIAERNISPRRKYIFDLGQSELTPRQLDIKVNDMLHSLFRLRNLPHCQSPAHTVGAWWASAALAAGLSGSEVISVLGFSPDAIPHLALSEPAALPADEKDRIKALVRERFSCNPPGWYAMRLRPRVAYSSLIQRLAALSGVPVPELFYPLQEIARRVEKKIIFEQKPLIRDVVFFRYRTSDIPRLFSSISDIAWCYTVSGKAGAPYARISDAAFTRFQQAIGQFSSQCRTQLDNLPKGTDIKVVAGLFQGLQSELDKIVNEDGENIFRFLYQSPNGIRWNIGVDSRNTRVAPPSQPSHDR